jgi:hypothetical protein
VLVENHSLKPYKRRVLGTYVLLAETMGLLAREKASLREARDMDRQRRPALMPLGFERDMKAVVNRVPFKGIRSELYGGAVSGTEVVRWTGQPVSLLIPEFLVSKPKILVQTPAAYIVPPAWADVVERIRFHGIEVEQLQERLTTRAEIYRLPGAAMAEPSDWSPNPFEGNVRIDPGEPVRQVKEMTFPAGSFRISTDQPLGGLAVLLLEPQAPDSFLQWGFFLEIFTQTEYAEAYVMEPLAEKMLQEDATLRARFEQKLASDEKFAANPQQRLMWFYQQTPFYDQQYLLYPVARIPGGQ